MFFKVIGIFVLFVASVITVLAYIYLKDPNSLVYIYVGDDNKTVWMVGGVNQKVKIKAIEK